MNLIDLIIIGIIAMLSLAFGIIFFVVMYQRRVIRHQQEIRKINDRKQLELIQASIQGEEEERMRIASELHDDVGATLSSVRLFLHAAARENADPDIMRKSKDLLDDSIRKIRNISHKLQPTLLLQLGLQASLDSFAKMICIPGEVTMTYTCPAPLPRFDDSIELSVYRIVQELTSNMLRHAGADTLAMETYISAGLLLATITYNGEGMTEEMYRDNIYKKGSIGLKNIVTRLKTVDAFIRFEKQATGQFQVTLKIPVPLKTQQL